MRVEEERGREVDGEREREKGRVRMVETDERQKRREVQRKGKEIREEDTRRKEKSFCGKCLSPSWL